MSLDDLDQCNSSEAGLIDSLWPPTSQCWTTMSERSWLALSRLTQANGAVSCSPSTRMGFNHGGTPEFAAIYAVAARHNDISNILSEAPGRFEPIYRRKPNRDIDARPWCRDFYAAIQLRISEAARALPPQDDQLMSQDDKLEFQRRSAAKPEREHGNSAAPVWLAAGQRHQSHG